MPRITRYFPVSHDINADHEVWEMRDTIGEKSLSIWLELLSIADRNSGDLPPCDKSFSRALAFKCRTKPSLVLQVWYWGCSKHWIEFNPTPRLRSYAKFHKTRGTNEIPIASPPKQPKQPKQPEHKESAKAPFVLPDWIDSKVWEAYETMRKDIGHPLKDSSRTRLINGLAKLKAAGNDVDACLDRSTMNGWRGVFPEPSHNGRVSRIDEARARTQAILKRGLE
jgi:hypothetical protein